MLTRSPTFSQKASRSPGGGKSEMSYEERLNSFAAQDDCVISEISNESFDIGDQSNLSKTRDDITKLNLGDSTPASAVMRKPVSSQQLAVSITQQAGLELNMNKYNRFATIEDLGFTRLNI